MPGRVENVLNSVEKVRQLMEAAGRAGALQRVHDPECAVDQRRVSRIGLKFEQGGLEFTEEIGGLLAEDLAAAALDFVKVHWL